MLHLSKNVLVVLLALNFALVTGCYGVPVGPKEPDSRGNGPSGPSGPSGSGEEIPKPGSGAGENPPSEPPPSEPPPSEPPPPVEPPPFCALGRTYAGFDGRPLDGTRPPMVAIGVDRARIKPFSALAGEYERVLGAPIEGFADAEASFPTAPDRWFVEPFGSAVVAYSAFQLGFRGCIGLSDRTPAFSEVPTQATATEHCRALAQKFWDRAPSDEQVGECVNLVVNQTAIETDPKRRWAYGCAALLTSAEFLSY